MAARACNPRAWDAVAEESWVWAQPELSSGTEDVVTQLLQPSPSLVTPPSLSLQDISSISEVPIPYTNALKSTTASGVLGCPLPNLIPCRRRPRISLGIQQHCISYVPCLSNVYLTEATERGEKSTAAHNSEDYVQHDRKRVPVGGRLFKVGACRVVCY